MAKKNSNIKAENHLTTEQEKIWITFYADEQLNTPTRLEEIAKYLTGIIAISLTIFIDKRPVNLEPWTGLSLTIASVIWISSALMSFIVLFPWRYRYNAESYESIHYMHLRVVRTKWWFLIVSVVLYLLALGFSIFAFTKGWIDPPLLNK